MTTKLLKKILILVIIIVVVFALSTSFTSAKYVHQDSYTFTVVTTAPGYSYVFSPAETSEAKSIGVTLDSYLAGTNRINVYNVSGSTITAISITTNYTSKVKNKTSTATFSIYNSAGVLIATSSNFTFQRNRTADVSVSFSSLSLPNDGYVYVTMTGVTLNSPTKITLNTITVSIT
ncbi:MAG: hypothetical protein PHD50_02145 [Bacilli bacterium]|nr:hypothetical protein [Bacilli bacterium]